MANDNDPMAEIKASFFIECEELLESLQDGLQSIEEGAADAETINVVFRAVHSIKGGAGAFGLEDLVRFAHRYETVLDRVRSGQMAADQEALKIFFQAADHLSDLVRISRDDLPSPEGRTTEILKGLDGLMADEAGAERPQEAEEEQIDFQPTGISIDLDLGDGAEMPLAPPPDLDDLPPPPPLPDAAQEADWQITFAPLAELFDTGNEPALLLRNLSELGRMETRCDLPELPDLAGLQPEIPHLVWTISLTTNADAAEIASVFEFVEGLCRLEIVPAPAQEAGSAPEPIATEAASASPEPKTSAEGAEPKIALLERASEPEKATPIAAKSVVRVDLERIERLVNLVGELVINQAMLSQSLERSGLSPHSDAMNGLEEFQRLTRDIQDSVMMIRAQPVKSLFQRMSRIIREASAAVDKEVRLQTSGEATEVDKTVIERLADPLTHMIRNAVDHGLESRERRIAAGKPAQGNVTLSAAHRSGRVIIEVQDDGAGINRARVKQIAVDKGLIPPDAQLSDTEIDNLLFLPGFSTASEVSDLSGRGVGMDVVRTAIQALGGRITIASTPGEGTNFSISLPLTLAVLDGMVVRVAGETLVLPLNLVVETLTLKDKEVQQVRPGSHVIEVRSGFVPIFDLGAALGYRPPLESFAETVVLLIAQEDETQTALVIDDILDQRQVVIKGLDDSFYRAPGIAAATILGDGQIALIIDPSDIIQSNLRPPGRPPANEEIGVSA